MKKRLSLKNALLLSAAIISFLSCSEGGLDEFGREIADRTEVADGGNEANDVLSMLPPAVKYEQVSRDEFINKFENGLWTLAEVYDVSDEGVGDYDFLKEIMGFEPYIFQAVSSSVVREFVATDADPTFFSTALLKYDYEAASQQLTFENSYGNSEYGSPYTVVSVSDAEMRCIGDVFHKTPYTAAKWSLYVFKKKADPFLYINEHWDSGNPLAYTHIAKAYFMEKLQRKGKWQSVGAYRYNWYTGLDKSNLYESQAEGELLFTATSENDLQQFVVRADKDAVTVSGSFSYDLYFNKLTLSGMARQELNGVFFVRAIDDNELCLIKERGFAADFEKGAARMIYTFRYIDDK